MSGRRWVRVCSLAELEPGRGVAAMVGGRQVALFRLPGPATTAAARLRAVDNLDPVTNTNVLARGLVGSTGEVDYVASPMLKHRFDLASGRCLDGDHPPVRVWPVRAWGGTVEVLAGDEGPDPPPRRPVTTTCPFCALQCTFGLTAPRGGSAPAVVADASSPVNRGRLCVKGWSAAGLLRVPDRLTTPLVRDAAGSLRTASWDAALDELAGRIDATRRAHGADAVGVFGSGALTNEAAYLLGKFARLALRTPHIDYNGRFCMASAAAAANRSLGLDRGLPFPL
ncbi:MAG TPA: nitrite reductase small subunit NirD, partial [Acidimicrobiales bacterium]|nr:nitrite reductase small subunit NirD [Acidimicrobiales bacterium]